jgi:archaeal flagellar protein FlaJ
MVNNILDVEKLIEKEITALNEIIKLNKNKESDKKMNLNQITLLENFIKETNKEVLLKLEEINLTRSLKEQVNSNIDFEKYSEPLASKQKISNFGIKQNFKLDALDEDTIKRLNKKEKVLEIKQDRKPNGYVSLANKLFSETSDKLLKEPSFDIVKRDLIKSNLPFLAKSYVSIILLTTVLSLVVGFFVMIFFLFFNLSSFIPFIEASTEAFSTRIIKVIWIPVFLPIVTFLIMYLYPSLEKSSLESRINHELPFATIHMSAISGSNVEPSKIFEIIISTKEYPYLEKEFHKVTNEMNIFGRDLVSALRITSFNCPSKKLSELYNGLATTITSGGDLAEFFDKRSSSLLFDYRIEREKETKSAETFMDIYISVVIAAPMILMLLLIMMKVSGIGISFSTGMITLMMIAAVSVINVGFLALLQMKQQK